MSQIQNTLAFIIEAKPIRESQWRCSAFSRECGLLAFFSTGKMAPSSPLSENELILIEKNETFRLKELKVINPHLKLRNDLVVLSCASEMLKLCKNQLAQYHPVPHIYDLLRFYLEKLPTFPSPHILRQSFLLKLLLAEGTLNFPIPGDFSEEEQDWMMVLACSKSLNELTLIPFSPDLDARLLTYLPLS